jgi:hypothetical protein
MGSVVKVLGGEGGLFTQDWKIDADTIAGSVAIRSTATNSAGEVVDSSTTSFTNAIGVYEDTVTYTAAPTLTSPEGVVRVITHPFAISRWQLSGTAANGPLATTAPANVLTNTVADATKLIVTAAEVGTVSFVGGLLKGRSGANMGQTRRIITHNNNADTRAEVAFRNTIGVGDTFIRVPYSKAVIAGTLTTELTRFRADLAIAGGAINTYAVVIDEVNDLAWIEIMFRDHLYSALA